MYPLSRAPSRSPVQRYRRAGCDAGSRVPRAVDVRNERTIAAVLKQKDSAATDFLYLDRWDDRLIEAAARYGSSVLTFVPPNGCIWFVPRERGRSA